MTYTERFTYFDSATCYAKPKPIVDSPWGDDVVSCPKQTTFGDFAEFLTDSLTDKINYVIFEQVGGTPAATDTPIFNLEAPTIQQTLNKLRNAKVK